MQTIGIIQPAKIGDILICLPIAQYFAKQHIKIYWPITAPIFNMFERHVNYVNFLPVNNNIDTMISESLKILTTYKQLKLAFYFPNTIETSEEFSNQYKYSFDEFKYFLANVPFNEKWNLKIQRNIEREQALYNKLITNPNYIVYHNRASDYHVNYKLDVGNKDYDIIEITDQTDDIFDWIMILEHAKKLILIESCFSNLVDQLHIKTDKILLLKHGYYGQKLQDGTFKGMPRLIENWKII